MCRKSNYYKGSGMYGTRIERSTRKHRWNILTISQTEGHKKLKLVAISGDSEEPISPCGICRQFIREFGPNVPVFMFNKDGSKFIKVFLQDLLPLSFGPENLGIEPAH